MIFYGLPGKAINVGCVSEADVENVTVLISG